jgi:hypothetical protein
MVPQPTTLPRAPTVAMLEDDKIVTVTKTLLTLLKLDFVGSSKSCLLMQMTLEDRSESSVNSYKFYTEPHLRAVLAAHKIVALPHSNLYHNHCFTDI